MNWVCRPLRVLSVHQSFKRRSECLDISSGECTEDELDQPLLRWMYLTACEMFLSWS